MQMTPEEVKRRFKNMIGNEKDRVQILADLNACPRKKILEIIGKPETEMPFEIPEEKLFVTPNNIQIIQKHEPFEEGTAIYNLVAARLDELEHIINSATKEYEELAKYLQKGEADGT